MASTTEGVDDPNRKDVAGRTTLQTRTRPIWFRLRAAELWEDPGCVLLRFGGDRLWLKPRSRFRQTTVAW
jgi:hypothetical protein